ncbi:SCO family protein [Marilutibacter chinensis]|uniref:SCO family protein n=1 Tax=Marilutibacter chinensis TaxID=2912247 RepID=A0ABS9HRJ0_9GAMM|nr:SCO family protein [Lysobacter chinensis]MCF7221126.1 SCO family protein [Lysobacter chinensis]
MKRGRPFILAVILFALPALSAAVDDNLPGDSVYQVQAQLTDQAGRVRPWRELRGRPTVVSMFYANCHLTCPLIIANGKALQAQLSPHEYASLDFAMLSIDPERDTPEALMEVAEVHRLDPGHWHLLRPEQSDVRMLAAVLGIRYRAQPDGSFNHTSALILLDGDGRIVARSQVAGVQPDPGFVVAVREHLSATR